MNKILLNLFLIIMVSLTLNGCGGNLNQKYEGFMMPESVAEGPDGSIYVSEIGERDIDKDGKISKINSRWNHRDCCIWPLMILKASCFIMRNYMSLIVM